MRVFALSDLHVDYDVNAKWLANLSRSDHTNDALILAGDVSDVADQLEHSLKLLANRFAKVLYVPGNHDLWVIRGAKQTSLEKYKQVCQIAKECGVMMDPLHCGALSIVPLRGWYDYSFGEPSSELRDTWMDYSACAWPDDFDAKQITRYFCGENRPALQTRNETVISFSHFVPRLDLMPFYISKSVKLLFPVLGSMMLGEQIRWLEPTIHIYGHSHLNQRVQLDGITYINNAFGYPSETRIARKKLLCVYEA